MNSALCGTCQAILRPQSLFSLNYKDDSKSFDLLTTTSHNFEPGANHGCRLCLFFLSSLSQDDVLDMRRHSEQGGYQTKLRGHIGKNGLELIMSHQKEGISSQPDYGRDRSIYISFPLTPAGNYLIPIALKFIF